MSNFDIADHLLRIVDRQQKITDIIGRLNDRLTALESQQQQADRQPLPLATDDELEAIWAGAPVGPPGKARVPSHRYLYDLGRQHEREGRK